MKTWKYLIPLASVAFGLWACGDESNASSAECTTQECLEKALLDEFGEFNADSANQALLDSINAALQNMAGGDSTSASGNVVDNPQGGEQTGTTTGDTSSIGENPLTPTDSGSVNPNQPVVSDSGKTVASDTTKPVTVDTTHHVENPFAKSSSSVVVPVVVSSSSVVPETPVTTTTFKEDHRDECQIGDIPSSVNNAKLPDPFMGLDGKRISSKADWKCRREEIGAMYEKLMFGAKPRKPEKVEGSISGKTFTVKVTDKGKSASFTVEISGAGTKDKPKPAMIGFGGGMMGNSCGSLGGSLSGLDIAQIIFNPDNVAPEGTRGSGKFYDIYGSGNEAGTIMAWAWGVSRLIDALEKTPEAGIDVHHLGMTGCSRWGKGSLAVGAFDERIALTIPQESGSGGASLWRVGAQVNKQKGKQFVQGLNSAGSEGNWMRTSFKNYDGKENTLPFDQHMLVDMVAPRALLILDNAGQEWLGEVPSNYCGQAAKEVFDALGATENYTYSQEGGHAHCSLPNGQFDEVKDFINKFLLGKDAKTGKIDYSKNSEQIKWNKTEWIDWTTPTLN
ncbi:MAG: hypothetical protein MJY99_03645 [Fibrobacter sp.]|nr:hypothetical protein [Fibrobacter sp.]